MKSPVNLELIFPIKDAPSASFMSFKASCLRDAGIITESEKHWVDARVLSVLAGETTAARPSDLLKILGRELREHYELRHNLPHGMFTLLMELSDRGGSPLRTRADKYRALAERALNKNEAAQTRGNKAASSRN
jgi:hypothetical protein